MVCHATFERASKIRKAYGSKIMPYFFEAKKHVE